MVNCGQGDGEDGSWGGRKIGGIGRWIVRNWDGEGGKLEKRMKRFEADT